MIRIAFYAEHFPDVALISPGDSIGNPGMGGVEFAFWSIPYYLNTREETLSCSLLCEQESEAGLHVELHCLSDWLEDNSIDILVIRGDDPDYVMRIRSLVKTETILWLHDMPRRQLISFLGSSEGMSIICVSYAQKSALGESVRNHDCYVIPNTVDFRYFPSLCPSRTKEPLVAFFGSLSRNKTFHILTRNWRRIRQAIPEARLMVVGGGNLHNRKKPLGSLGIATPEYEKMFTRGIIDEKGIDSSIVFYGVTEGSRKYELLRKAKVGVVNPLGIESFCISAIELEALGVPIVSSARGGLKESVFNGTTGLLCLTEEEFVDSIISLLSDDDLCEYMSSSAEAYAKSRFSVDEVSGIWARTLLKIKHSELNDV